MKLMIAVIGATGHIGNVLTRLLVEQRNDVVAVVPPGEDLKPIEQLPVQIRFADIRELSAVEKALEGCERVFHVAGYISIKPGEKEKLWCINVEGTKNVVQACLTRHVSRLVYTSSIHALAEPPVGTTIDETQPLQPGYGDYAFSKAEATKVVLEATKSGLEAVVVCPTGVIGPYDFKLSEMGSLIRSYLLRKVVFYIDGAYDFVDVRDVARGLILAMEKGRSGELYILCGERVEVRDLLKMLMEVTGRRRVLVRIPHFVAKLAGKLGSLLSPMLQRPLLTDYSFRVLQSNSVVSCEKAKRDLGFEQMSIRESMTDTVIWLAGEDQCQ